MHKRVDIKSILADPKLRWKLIEGVVEFCCKLEDHEHAYIRYKLRKKDEKS